jgi:CBS domain-containing protein
MKAKNIMTTELFTARPDATVREIAVTMAEKGISAVPVLDRGKVVGIVSEGDLLHRQELGTERHRTRLSWVKLLEDEEAMAAFEAKEHGMSARDIMTCNVIGVAEDASMGEIADTLEKNNIKRLLVMRGDKLVGVVSRANIVRAIAARPEGANEPTSSDDDELRFKILETLENMRGTSPWLTTVIVSDGVVFLYGTVEDEAMRDPSRIAIEKIPYVVDVQEHRGILQPY